MAFTGIPVADLDPALEWYERFMGRAPDMRPHDGEAAWQLTQSGWMYVVRDRERAGRGLLTLMVDDLDATLAELSERSIGADQIEELSGGVRKATLTDPEGNNIALGQVPG
ncbi:MAG TPA: VOC family protein [Thermoleophilaceae bacterium]|nr:VOC family protein [Thermoleophilaceae bacterium]